MSAKILDATDSVITVKITSTISPADLATNQADVLKQLQVVADRLIHKMAIIGERQWESMALAFSEKDHRPFPNEFFPTGHLHKANSLLKA